MHNDDKRVLCILLTARVSVLLHYTGHISLTRAFFFKLTAIHDYIYLLIQNVHFLSSLGQDIYKYLHFFCQFYAYIVRWMHHSVILLCPYLVCLV